MCFGDLEYNSTLGYFCCLNVLQGIKKIDLMVVYFFRIFFFPFSKVLYLVYIFFHSKKIT